MRSNGNDSHTVTYSSDILSHKEGISSGTLYAHEDIL